MSYEGNILALHTHQIWPCNEQYVTMDFFRFDDFGKIVEHWDSIQQIPESSANGNQSIRINKPDEFFSIFCALVGFNCCGLGTHIMMN